MKAQTKFRSIFNIQDHVPSKRKPVFHCYDNKTLARFTHDDFAEYVFDNMNLDGTFDKNSFLCQIEMLDYIPDNYGRVYLYGVWDVVKEAIRVNKKIASKKLFTNNLLFSNN